MKEDWKEAISDPQDRKVFEELADPRWDFRTVGGIAESAGIDSSVVRDVIERYSDFVRRSAAPGPNGEDLFTLHEPTLREAMSIARGAISKSAPSSS